MIIERSPTENSGIENDVSILEIAERLVQHLPGWSDADALDVMSQMAAGTSLEGRMAAVAPELLVAVLRLGARQPAGESSAAVSAWMAKNAGRWGGILSPKASDWPAVELSLGGSQSDIALASARQQREEAQRLYDSMMEGAGATLAIGAWMEHRSVYSTDNYRSLLIPGARRDHHLGYDLFAPAMTPVYMPMAGRIVQTGVIDERLDYGGFVVTEHEVAPSVPLYALWGHLSHGSAMRRQSGEQVAEGEVLAVMGDFEENGWWLPHLHLQLSTLAFDDFRKMPGVGEGELRDLWTTIFPNPTRLVMGR